MDPVGFLVLNHVPIPPHWSSDVNATFLPPPSLTDNSSLLPPPFLPPAAHANSSYSAPELLENISFRENNADYSSSDLFEKDFFLNSFEYYFFIFSLLFVHLIHYKKCQIITIVLLLYIHPFSILSYPYIEMYYSVK